MLERWFKHPDRSLGVLGIEKDELIAGGCHGNHAAADIRGDRA